MDPATKKDNVLSFLIDLKIVAKAAEDKKLENTEDFKKRLAFTRSRLLMDNLLATEGKAATTDDAMKKVYEEASKQITGEQEVHARHILVESEDEAKAVKAELDKGANFAELAKKKSKDPGAADGGDLGFFTKEQMVPEFSAVAFALEPGKISDPVKSQFGWHIIKVEEKRSRAAPAFDQVKGQIETYVTRKAQADYVAKLREAAKVERMDKPADAAASPKPEPDAAKQPRSGRYEEEVSGALWRSGLHPSRRGQVAAPQDEVGGCGAEQNCQTLMVRSAATLRVSHHRGHRHQPIKKTSR